MGVEAPGVGEVVGMAVTQVPLAHQVGGVPRLLQVLPRPIFKRYISYKAELKVLVFRIFPEHFLQKSYSVSLKLMKKV